MTEDLITNIKVNSFEIVLNALDKKLIECHHDINVINRMLKVRPDDVECKNDIGVLNRRETDIKDAIRLLNKIFDN